MLYLPKAKASRVERDKGRKTAAAIQNLEKLKNFTINPITRHVDKHPHARMVGW